MPRPAPRFACRLAETADDLVAAQRLRYSVFVRELGAGGPLVDHVAKRESDRFDPFCDHLLLFDDLRPEDDRVVGVYRLLREDGARDAGGFYSEGEYDLAPLFEGRRRLLELGRSCLHRDYRGGMAMMHLWAALSDYVQNHGIEVLFGTASFHGTDTAALAAPLSVLHHRHLAPEPLRVRARPPQGIAMDVITEAAIDRAAAMRAVPALIKAYLRLGGFVGLGAWVDHAFNTTDVCLVLDTANMNLRQRDLYTRDRP